MIYLCLDKDVPEGGFRCFKLFHRNMIATKVQGTVFVDKNECAHRGFPVGPAQGGELPLHCPYHGLQFFPKGELPSFRIFNFVFFGDGQIELSSSERALMLAASGEEFHEETHDVAAPFHLWMQNTMDPNHLPFVHGEGFSKSFDARDQPYDVWISHCGTASAYKLRVREDVVRSYSRILRGHSPDPFFHHMTFFPHLSITSFMGVFYSIETASPTEKGCKVRTRFFHNPTIAMPPMLLKSVVAANKRILQEDRDICERWAEGAPIGNRFWMRGEDRIQAYLALCAREGLLC